VGWPLVFVQGLLQLKCLILCGSAAATGVSQTTATE